MYKIKNFKLHYLYIIILSSIILLGLLLRIKQYIIGIPIWFDEVLIYLNLIETTYLGYFKELNYCQICPPIYLCITKLISNTFGFGIYPLRFLSFVSGFLSLPLFYILLKKTLKSKIPILVAMFIFAVNGPLIYYTAELKQYITDVTITILIFILYDKFNINGIKNFFFWLILFVIFALCSYTSFIAMGALLIIKSVEFLKDKSETIKDKIIYITKTFIIALTLLALCIYIQDTHRFTKAFMFGYNAGYKEFLPVYFKNILQNFFIYLNFQDKLSLIILVYGLLLSLFSKNVYLKLALTAFILQMIAAYFNLYPLLERLSLNFIPILILLMSKTVDTEDLPFKYPYSTIISCILMTIMMYSFNIIDNTKNVFDYNYVAIAEPTNIRQYKKDEIINFLNRYKSGEPLISTGAFNNVAMYYNRIYKYNLEINYIFYVLDNKDEEMKLLNFLKTYNNAFWITGIVNTVIENHQINTDEEIENIIINSSRKFDEYQTLNGNIYYIYPKI